jgi:UDP-N-acetylmuramoyl-tripeptide--D-alanyl-D-alanine ligase
MEWAMTVRSLAWVEQALADAGRLRKCELFGRGDVKWHGASIDTRGECSQRVFVAIRGEQTDGHQFAAEARSQGSCAIIVESEDVAADLARVDAPHFLVDNSLTALQDLSRAYRDTLDVRAVAITGSAGKTTTKEYVRAILKKKYKVHSNPGNYNNHIGVPLTLLDADHDTEYLVSEVGANHVGEIDFLTRMIRPDIGVITNVGDAHIGLFGSRERIAEAKSELLAGLGKDGHAVLPRDDDFFETLKDRCACRAVTFGFAEDSTYRLGSIAEHGDVIEFRIADEPLSIKSYGIYNVLNAGAAFSVGELCGVEVSRIRDALAEVEPVRGRAQVHRTPDMTLIDDSYNANPTSMRSAIAGLQRFPGRKHIAVLGDMAELGDYTEPAHRDLGEDIAAATVDVVYWLGHNGSFVEAGMRGRRPIKIFDSLHELIAALQRDLEPGDVILVKASRSAELDRVVDRLLGVAEESG